MKDIITISKRQLFVFIMGVWMLTATSCSEFLDIGPPQTEIVNQQVFSSDASAFAAVRGIYSLMMTNTSFTNGRIEELTGITSDELINYSTNAEQVQFYQNTLSTRNSYVLSIFWSEAYSYIANANAIVEGLNTASGMTIEGKKQVEGEAKFIRAFSHFYLATLFGDVPYLTSTDYRINQKAPRLAVTEVYTKLVQDLKEAEALLSSDYSFSSNERIQPNKFAATALLSRVYLYMQEWDKAEASATAVINNSTLYQLPANLNEVFLSSSQEAIWQLKPVVPGSNTTQAITFTLTDAPDVFARRVSLRESYVNSFDNDDNRKLAWIGEYSDGQSNWFYPSKYKVTYATDITEYNTVLRLAEQYLVRAEARARQNNSSGSVEDLNVIRTRAGLAAINSNEKEAILNWIEDERKHELFAEWGHRWLDLKRSGKINTVIVAIKPLWETTDSLFPVPESERLLNTSLSQNPGY